MQRAELLNILYQGRDPFADFPIQEYTQDLQGWGGTHPIFQKTIDLYRPSLVVEVGSWKGESAVTMGRALKSIGGTLICIDTWLGAEEHFVWGILPQRNGYPTLYYQFAANMILNGLSDVVIPLPQTSHIGAEILRAKGLRPEVIYIDASHEYGDVLVDLQRFGSLLADGGCIIGDDYHYGWPGVAKAAREYAASVGLDLYIYETKYFLTRDPTKIPDGCIKTTVKHQYFDTGDTGYIYV